METPPLVLGSASPRRRELMSVLGLPLVIDPPQVDESILQGELPRDYVHRVGALKRDCVVARWQGRACRGVLTADTIVTFEDRILTKPQDRSDAVAMLLQLSGRTHQVMTAYHLWSQATAATCSRTVTTDVTFRVISQAEAERYADTGEGLDKAGGYAVQGGAMVFARELRGSWANVVGLPVCELYEDLQGLGLASVSELFAHHQ